MSYEERFFQKVEKTESCWLWKGALNSRGYGSFGAGGKVVSAHRYSYEMHIGEIPTGMVICHSCDVRNCVNPEHLWAGSTAENNRDMFKKDRNGSSSRPKTHCKRGHEMTEENVYSRKMGDGKTERVCRECKRQSANRRRYDPKTRQKILDYEREYQKKYVRKKK